MLPARQPPRRSTSERSAQLSQSSAHLSRKTSSTAWEHQQRHLAQVAQAEDNTRLAQADTHAIQAAAAQTVAAARQASQQAERRASEQWRTEAATHCAQVTTAAEARVGAAEQQAEAAHARILAGQSKSYTTQLGSKSRELSELRRELDTLQSQRRAAWIEKERVNVVEAQEQERFLRNDTAQAVQAQRLADAHAREVVESSEHLRQQLEEQRRQEQHILYTTQRHLAEEADRATATRADRERLLCTTESEMAALRKAAHDAIAERQSSRPPSPPCTFLLADTVTT